MVPPVAKKQTLVEVDLVIYARGQARPLAAVDLRVFKILKAARGRSPVRHWVVFQRIDCDRIEPLGGNHVPRKWGANKSGSRRHRGGRIVNREETARPVEGLRKV